MNANKRYGGGKTSDMGQILVQGIPQNNLQFSSGFTCFWCREIIGEFPIREFAPCPKFYPHHILLAFIREVFNFPHVILLINRHTVKLLKREIRQKQLSRGHNFIQGTYILYIYIQLQIYKRPDIIVYLVLRAQAVPCIYMTYIGKFTNREQTPSELFTHQDAAT